MAYSFGKTVDLGFEEAIERVTECLKAEGFGILTQIDISQAMKEKLGEEIPPYRILGACNPPLAFRALSVEPEIGALLPCNVVVREDGDGVLHVTAMDPVSVLQLVDHPDVAELAAEVRGRLERALEAV